MNKKLIRLTESDLHNIIKESVKKILREADWKTYANAGKKASELGQHERAAKFRDAAIDRFNTDYGYEDDVRSLKVKSAYDDGFNDWRVRRNGQIISPLDANTPHMSLRYDYDDGNGYQEYGKTSTDLENDGERTIYGDYDASENTGFGMSSAPIGHFPIGGFEEKDGKYVGRNDKGFEEFDNYRKGKYDYNKGKGWRLKK